MTEMTKIKEVPPFDVIAFVLALIGGPVLVTLITCFTIIPIFALIVGGPLYLIVGTPTLLWMVGRYPPEFGRYSWAGLCSILVLMVAVVPLSQRRPDLEIEDAFSFLFIGTIFAPLWAGTFAHLYRRFNPHCRT